MKRVKLHVHTRTSRVPFRSGERDARLYEVDKDDIETTLVPLYTTRGHETWASAARAALKKADRKAWFVIYRDRIEHRIAAEAAEDSRG